MTRDLPGSSESWARPAGGASEGPLALGQQFCLGTQFPYLSATRLSHTGDFPVFTRQPHHSVHLKSKRVRTDPHTQSSPPRARRAHPAGQFGALGSKMKWISTHSHVRHSQACPSFPQGQLPNLPEAIGDLLG